MKFNISGFLFFLYLFIPPKKHRPLNWRTPRYHLYPLPPLTVLFTSSPRPFPFTSSPSHLFLSLILFSVCLFRSPVSFVLCVPIKELSNILVPDFLNVCHIQCQPLFLTTLFNQNLFSFLHQLHVSDFVISFKSY